MQQAQSFAFLPHSAPTQEKHWTKRLRFFVPCRRLTSSHLRLLRLFGNTTSKKVTPSVGPEQEYFLVDKKKYLQRKDLIFTGRTLFGAMPPKGQEMDDHYFRYHPSENCRLHERCKPAAVEAGCNRQDTAQRSSSCTA